MKQASDGDKVKVHYTGKLDDGTVFDSSRDRGEPLEFSLGGGQLIKGFNEAVKGMSPGETKTIRIPSDEAYGPPKEALIIKTQRSKISPNIELKEGLHLQMTQSTGTVLNVMITEISGDNVTLDANHPLTGKDLIFDIELVEITAE